MTTDRNRVAEGIVYTVIWVVVTGLYLLGTMRHRVQMSETLLDINVVIGMVRTIVPLFIVFVINNNLLIPRLLLRNRWKTYVAVIVCVLLLLLCYQYYDFCSLEHTRIRRHGHLPPPNFRPLMPMPVLLDFSYGLLVVGVNLAISLLFRRYDDRLERESLLKANAENQLAYLKAQINPHFYLNMLNNIHGMIDIDPGKAQSMLIDMSKLMRFMLYDSSKPRVALSEEIGFLKNYLTLMRQRYPAERVDIRWKFPSAEEVSGIFLPPLLFLSFIENAFKHGISYRIKSYISVEINITEDRLGFECVNSVYDRADALKEETSGIGLKNIKERLRLLYGDSIKLTIAEEKTEYKVTLILPIHENPNTDN